jgi:hypothetical protein
MLTRECIDYVTEFWIRSLERPTASTLNRSYRIHQLSSDQGCRNPATGGSVCEVLLLIIVVRTIAVESRLGVVISDSVCVFPGWLPPVLKPPFKQETFSLLVLLVLSGGFPTTHLDLIGDDIILFANPLDVLPESFCGHLTKRRHVRKIDCTEVAQDS